ncbi:hypothetical protein GIB67_014133 [Kingdonia uniflora]|uniref:Uncharacterized protein n=1 Tax=Kingdonia uniflora TaxID=39325 RepID=A0A7J7N3Y7_9MAGN|nr:hypothetical protein GIB67_014133 [Kingdonia uniflora]
MSLRPFLGIKISYCWRSVVVQWGQYRCSQSRVVTKWYQSRGRLNLKGGGTVTPRLSGY